MSDLSELERLEREAGVRLKEQNDVADVLRRARALVDTPRKWVGGGRRYQTFENCAATAIGNASGDNGINEKLCAMARGVFADAIGALNSIGGIWDWNDAPERTHADVLAAFDAAIALAEQQA